jgi:ubiquinone/menaquinone biosynthesis C-methylase UbiE
MRDKSHEAGTPMPFTRAKHLLNPFRAFLLSPKKMVKRLELEDKYAVLEIGPGPGYYSPAVAKRIKNGKLTLMDIQIEMLDMAKNRLTKFDIKNVEYLKGNACNIPLANQSFDVVFLVAVLGEIPNQKKCINEIKRVLKSNGLLSITEMKFADPDAIPIIEIKRLIENEGFHEYSRYGNKVNYTIGFKKQV